MQDSAVESTEVGSPLQRPTLRARKSTTLSSSQTTIEQDTDLRSEVRIVSLVVQTDDSQLTECSYETS